MAAKKKPRKGLEFLPFDFHNPEHQKVFTRYIKWNESPVTRRHRTEAFSGEHDKNRDFARQIVKWALHANHHEQGSVPPVHRKAQLIPMAPILREGAGKALFEMVLEGDAKNFRYLADELDECKRSAKRGDGSYSNGIIALPPTPKPSTSPTTVRKRAVLFVVKWCIFEQRIYATSEQMKEFTVQFIEAETGKFIEFGAGDWPKLLRSVGLGWVK